MAKTTAVEKNRLTKVISTKLSKEDYDSFQTIAHILCKSELIEHGTSSELLRRVTLDIVEVFRKKPDYYALRLKFGENNIQTGY